MTGVEALTEEDIELKQQLKNILEIVQDEKQSIEREFSQMAQQINRYEQLHQKLAAQQKNKKDRARTKEQDIVYGQLKSTLAEMNIDGDQVLQIGYSNEKPKESMRKLTNEEVVKVQKMIIQRLVTKLKEEAQLLRNSDYLLK